MKSYNGFTASERMKAYNWAKEEYANGSRQRPTSCDLCGQTEGVIEAHSEDYSAPYGPHIGEYGFCYRCHILLHCRFRCPDAWQSYLGMVRNGIPEALYSKNWNEIRSNMAGGWPAFTPAPAEGRYDRKGILPRLEVTR